jgi:diadenylate cyclase
MDAGSIKNISAFFSDLLGIVDTISFIDIVDIVLVAFLIYNALLLVRETRAVQLIKGIFVLIVVYIVSRALEFRALTFLIQFIFTIGAWAILVVFQPELRRALEQVGRSRFPNWSLFSFGNDADELKLRWKVAFLAVEEAAGRLAGQKTGALIVFERQTRLGEIIKTGTIIDALPSCELIENIFFPNSPLHDGATIIRHGRVMAAGCFLPLSDNHMIGKDMGTRHRAALGMSENSDSIVVVISEETGIISIANSGRLTRGFTPHQLTLELESFFFTEKREEKTDRRFILFKGNRGNNH